MKKKSLKLILAILVVSMFIVIGTCSYASSDIVVALDPGHGGTESGAVAGGLVEKNLTWKLATRVKEILDSTPGITGVLTKNENDTMDRYDRALNAKNNDVEDKITFIKSDLFKEIPKEKYDIIVSNPPYIRKEEIERLDREVKKEPHIALDGGEDGLDFYRKIIHNSEEYLKFNGYLCLEIGYDQKIDVIELIENEEKYKDTYSKKDLYGNDRIVITKLS